TLRVGFVEPEGYEFVVKQPGEPSASAQLLKASAVAVPPDVSGLQLGIDRIAELGISFEDLGGQVDQPIQFFIELLQGSQSRDRAPREGTISLNRPSSDFEQIMWDV